MHNVIKILLIFYVRNVFKVDFVEELFVLFPLPPPKYFPPNEHIRKTVFFFQPYTSCNLIQKYLNVFLAKIQSSPIK